MRGLNINKIQRYIAVTDKIMWHLPDTFARKNGVLYIILHNVQNQYIIKTKWFRRLLIST